MVLYICENIEQEKIFRFDKPAGENCSTVFMAVVPTEETRELESLKYHVKLKLNGKVRLNEITKTREVDKVFKDQIENDRVYACQKHFKPEDIETCKF